MSKPMVAVVGRPNVGKSTFFNRVCGKRISIVEDTPGVTRDRIYGDAEWCGYGFTLVDTGGIDLTSQDEIKRHIIKQAEIAIDFADVILFFVDGREGMTAADHDAATLLRKTKKPVLLVVNKLDNYEIEKTYDFYQLGMGEPIGISSEQAKGIGDLLDEVVKHFKVREDVKAEESLKIAIVGKPNAGKSSIVNKLLGFERVIVSQKAGTTVDSIDTDLVVQDKRFTLIDTAGIRRKSRIEPSSIERYSVIRAMASIKRADVVVILVDAQEGISEQDAKIAGLVHEEGKPSVIAVNKWDLIEKDTYTIQEHRAKVQATLSFMDYFLDIFLSAKTGQRVEKLLSLCQKAYDNASKRISTGVLNDYIMSAIAVNQPPAFAGRRVRINYCTQAETHPPTFVLFCNNPELMHFSYLRYLENSLRKAIDFSGTPIRLITRKKGE